MVSAYGRPAASDSLARSARFAQPNKKYDARFAQLVEPSRERIYRLALLITKPSPL
jgi:hypothetical protein